MNVFGSNVVIQICQSVYSIAALINSSHDTMQRKLVSKGKQLSDKFDQAGAKLRRRLTPRPMKNCIVRLIGTASRTPDGRLHRSMRIRHTRCECVVRRYVCADARLLKWVECPIPHL